jgi:DivIVA domain-containing protein
MAIPRIPDPSDPEEVGSAEFDTRRRGFDPVQVRAYLKVVARELARLRAREADLVAALEVARSAAPAPEPQPATPPEPAPPAPVEFDEARAVQLLGEETARVLATARAAAAEKLARAEEQAQAVLAAAQAEADEIRSGAQATIEAELAAARAEGRVLVTEARLVRERLLDELAARRHALRDQLEQMRAGRDRLARSYDDIRRALDEVSSALDDALPEAQRAARRAAVRHDALPVPDAAGIERELDDAARAGAPVVTRDEVDAAIEASTGDDDAPDWVNEGAAPPAEPTEPLFVAVDDAAAKEPGVHARASSASVRVVTLGARDLEPDELAQPEIVLAEITGGRRDAGLPRVGVPILGAPDAIETVRILRDEVPAASVYDAADEVVDEPAPPADAPAAEVAPEDIVGDTAAPEEQPEEPEVVAVAVEVVEVGIDVAAEDVPMVVGPRVAEAAPIVVTAPAAEPLTEAEPVPEAEPLTEAEPVPDAVADTPAAAGEEPAPVAEHDAERTAVAEDDAELTAAAEDDAAAPGDAEPQAATEPEPEPEPEPVTEPEPVPESEPEPVVEPEPEPVTEPEPEAVVEPEPEPEPEVAPAPAEPAPAPAAGVDDLFERIRRTRTAKVARAQQVLREPLFDPIPDGSPAAVAATATTDAAATDTLGTDDVVIAEDRIGAAQAGDAAHVAARDRVLEPLQAQMVRKLKRLLADEQNDVLDLVRRSGGKVLASGLVPEPGDHAGRYVAAIGGELLAAVSAGAAFFDGPAGAADHADVAALERFVATEVVEPLRALLSRALDAADVAEDEQLDRVRSAYREVRNQRIDDAARALALAAFNAGVEAAHRGGRVRWAVDPVHGCCSDCDDNALEGPIDAGLPFPTGATRPPAHPGCRCLLVPVDG